MTCRTDECNQGRKPCPTRQACEVPMDDDIADPATAIITAVVAAVALLAIVCAVLPVI